MWECYDEIKNIWQTLYLKIIHMSACTNCLKYISLLMWKISFTLSYLQVYDPKSFYSGENNS